ncbi:glycosyltransferase family protein [Fructobacillus ficulneus]|uniref:Uncharacterized protein n=1 Tax=Fructobacillus ficulneus TaxID=157463 RepID=A0A0K8MKY3_9LACO|nr:glycosyltransferase family 39 protein [Fructobacillus ficulneus]GAP00550.1 hypothetical protein FFIC_285690 [Fructobacillus ficulneus]
MSSQIKRTSFFAGFLAFVLIIGAFGNLATLTALGTLAFALLTLALIRVLRDHITRLPMRTLTWLIAGGFVLMMAAQVFVLKVMPDTIYHDPYRILFQADQMAAGHNHWTITYFWRYPNNVALTYFLSVWLRFTQLFHFSTNLAVHLLSFLLLNTFIALSLRTIWQLNRRKTALVGGFAFFACTPFAYTYYLQVFYSDLPSMLILLIIMQTLMFWRTRTPWKKALSALALVVVTTVGMLIKANLIVIVPAMAILAWLLWRQKLLKKSQLLLPMALITLGIGLSKPATIAINQVTDYSKESRYEFPATHWMMMGLNFNNFGMYSDADVNHEISLKSATERKDYNKEEITDRLTDLGPFRLVTLWIGKVGILLNVSQIQDWYNGGFRSAPAWYHNHQSLFQKLTIISYSSATILLFIGLITRLIDWKPNLSDSQEAVTLLAVITVLGYLGFHAILWEAEPRYGQIVFPLLIFAYNSLSDRQSDWNPPFITAKNQHLAMISTLTGAVLLLAINLIFPHQLKNSVITAQQSQLSAQYQAQPQTLVPGHTVSQKITLNQVANYFDLQVHAHVHVTAKLIRNSDHKVYHLNYDGGDYLLHDRLSPGSYTILIENHSDHDKHVDIVQTNNYKLTNHSLFINGTEQQNASLVYNCTNGPRTTQPLLVTD